MQRKIKLSFLIVLPLLITLAGLILTAFPDLSVHYGDAGPEILALGALTETALILFWLKEGAQHVLMFQDAEINLETMQNRFRTESLYRNTEHTDDWLQGFASGLEFFIDNYLSGYTVGPTETVFWQICRSQTGDKDGKQFNEQAYRQYMIQSVLVDNGITTEEFKTLCGMVSKENVRRTLATVLYSKETIQMYIDEAKETYKKKDL